jgi:sigma-B regulation protein RsbU (phosphoserine phosphatase)
LEPRPQQNDTNTGTLGQEWVTVLDVHDWQSGARCAATVNMQLNLPEIYNRISTIPSERQFGQILLLVLAFIGVLFLTIQFVALIIGFVLARQITGAVHDLFTGTEHLRNRDFTYHIPVRARDQLGELADSFNVMTGEITTLIRENAEKARMEQEMLAAREIQQRLLPSGPMTVPGLSITAFCEPAREVAGDYFDFLPISPTKLGVLIADVSGKGLPAGLYMAQLKVLVQSLARTHTSPADFLKAVNRVVADNIDSKSFITMSYGVIDLERRAMAFARAGHCPLVRVPGAAPAGLRKAELVTPDGLVLGLKIDDGTMFDTMIQEVTVPLMPDDLIVFFTDGISETMNDAFDCYGESRLARVLEQYAHLPFEQLRSFIFADLRAFAGAADQHDDMTMILLKVEADAITIH